MWVYKEVDDILETLGLERSLKKGVWEKGSIRIKHLECVWYITDTEITAKPLNVEKIRRIAQVFLRKVRAEQLWLTTKKLQYFAGWRLPWSYSFYLPVSIRVAHMTTCQKDLRIGNEWCLEVGGQGFLIPQLLTSMRCETMERLGVMQEEEDLCDISIYTDFL